MLWLASALARKPSKRWSEVLYLCYSPFWIIYALLFVVPLNLYEHFGKFEYMMICCVSALPCVLLPLILPCCSEDKGKPIVQRHWFKANLWIAIFSYVGNYFWTHYFYRVLGAYYTFKSWELNHVPICLYFMTHAYFMFYHSLSNVVIRMVVMRTSDVEKSATKGNDKGYKYRKWSWKTYACVTISVFLLSYATAFMETLTIANFKYYTFVDKGKMYRYF